MVRDIQVRGVNCRRSKYALYLGGYADAPIRNLSLQDCVFDHVARPNVLEHGEGLVLRGVRVNGETEA